MKRLTVFFLLSMFLCSTTELSHLLKVPLLFTHYYSHKEENKDLTFSDFWALHYVGENASIPHDDQDMKLPFKMHDHCALQLNVLFMPASTYALVDKKFAPIRLKHSSYLKGTSLTSSYLANIWQPPRAC